jgi:hypothetical protein
MYGLVMKQTQNDQLMGLGFYQHQVIPFTIFGYQSRSLPGLEIIGPPALKMSREKIIFLTRELGLKVAANRFHLCVELGLGGVTTGLRLPRESEAQKEILQWLELPLLILYWSLAGIIPLKRLTGCLSSGVISTHKTIFLPEFHSLEKHKQVLELFQHVKPVILKNEKQAPCHLWRSLELEALFGREELCFQEINAFI